MAEVTVSFDMDDDPSAINAMLDALANATGAQMFGLMVDGEHRDPDDPSSGLFD